MLIDYELEQSECLRHSSIYWLILLSKAKLRQRLNFHSERSSEKAVSQHFYAKNNAQATKFSQHQKSLHVIAYQRNRNILVKFDEIFLFFMIWWDLILTRLTSRSHQVWWVALVRFDKSLAVWWNVIIWIAFESLSDDESLSILMKMRSFESFHQRHIRRLTSRERAYIIRWIEIRQSKHWRWNN